MNRRLITSLVITASTLALTACSDHDPTGPTFQPGTVSTARGADDLAPRREDRGQPQRGDDKGGKGGGADDPAAHGRVASQDVTMSRGGQPQPGDDKGLPQPGDDRGGKGRGKDDPANHQ